MISAENNTLGSKRWGDLGYRMIQVMETAGALCRKEQESTKQLILRYCGNTAEYYKQTGSGARGD